MAINVAHLRDMLIEHEGLRLKPYKDTVGKITIGIGRNLTDNGISEAEAMMMLDNDIQVAIASLRRNLPWFDKLDPSRQLVLGNMCYNMGWPKLSAFKQTLNFIQNGSYELAAGAMLDSLWARQVGDRARDLADIMKTGRI